MPDQAETGARGSRVVPLVIVVAFVLFCFVCYSRVLLLLSLSCQGQVGDDLPLENIFRLEVWLMKRAYIFVFIAVLLLGLLVPLFSAERAGRHDSSAQNNTKLEQQETRQEESSRVSTVGDLSSENQPSGSPGGRAGKEDGKKTAGGTESKVSKSTSGRNTINNSSSEGASSKDSVDAQNGEKVPGIRIGVAVVGKKGELLFGPAEVVVRADSIWGITALGALDATGLPYEMSPRFPNLVVAVAGQRNEGQSGWMYKVNDEVPLVAASKRKLEEDDRVIWWYSTSISNPPPEWSSLKKSG